MGYRLIALLLLLALPVSLALSEGIVFKDGFEDIKACLDSEPEECRIPALTYQRVHINEIAPIPLSRGIIDEAGTAPAMPWLELYSDSTASIDLSTLSVSAFAEDLSFSLPAATLSNGNHFTIWFLPDATAKVDFGLQDDLDLSDGEGHLYVFADGTPSPVGDDIAVFREGVMEAFFAYGEAFEPTTALETEAVAAGLWPSGDRFNLETGATAGEGIGLFIDGFYPGLATTGLAPAVPDSADYLAVPWVELTAGIPQPDQAIQVSPRNGQMVVNYPVTLKWRACEGASGYLLHLYDSDAVSADPVQRVTASPEYTVDANDISANPIYWTVACMYEGNTRRTIFPPRWNFATGAGGGSDPGAAELTVGHEYQRKDSNMLCLYDARKGKGDGYGCEETIAGPDGACNWDAPHNVSSAAAVRACGPISENYCVRASIKMAHQYLVTGKPISQDYISFLGHAGKEPPGVAVAADPEGDLGAGRGMTVAQTVDVLSKVLNVGAGSITVENNPSHSDIRGWIDDGRPVIIFRWWKTSGGHATVIYGYQTTPFNGVFVHDPTDGAGLVMRYSHYDSHNLRANNPLTAIVPPASPGGSPVGDPPNSLHPIADASVFDDITDQDGVVNFDEIYRFKTDKDNHDSDFDQVGDKEEVYSYTFPKGKKTIVSRKPDIDSDGKRAELDCNADAKINNDHDGGEDIDGDGGKGEEFTGVGPGETDVFKAADGVRNLTLNQFFFAPGEEVRLSGGTLHGEYVYRVTTLPCPTIPDNTPLGGGAVFNTDSTGTGDDIIAICEQPGCFISYVDIADEGIWQETSQKCDTSLPWVCLCRIPDPMGDIIDVPSGLAIPVPPPMYDIVEFENQTTIGFEVDLTILTQPVPAPLAQPFFAQFIFEVDGVPGAFPVPFPWMEGGALVVDIVVLELGPPQLEVFVWDNSTNQWMPDPILPGQIQIELEPLGQPQLQVHLVMPGMVDLPGLPPQLPIVGVRVLTGDQPQIPQLIDVMPEPSQLAPALYDQFIDLGSCDQSFGGGAGSSMP